MTSTAPHQPSPVGGLHTPADLRSEVHDPLALTEEATRRLRGEGCVCCGSTVDLRDAGHAYTRSGERGRLGWKVKVCPGCPASYEGNPV
jgi:hypothetical protein